MVATTRPTINIKPTARRYTNQLSNNSTNLPTTNAQLKQAIKVVLANNSNSIGNNNVSIDHNNKHQLDLVTIIVLIRTAVWQMAVKVIDSKIWNNKWL